VQKNYKGADWVFYLPMDGPRNAKRFLEIVHPSLVIFVKYEFWYYYLKKIKYRNIPLLLVSALFRKDMPFFKWYGQLQRKMLSRFDHLFVQTTESKRLVDEIGLSDICSVSGDTRFDRVIEIAEQFRSLPAIEKFIDGNKTIVAGSTWPEDELVLQKTFSFPEAIRYSGLANQDINNKPARYLIIDNVGMLSRLYHYAYITYIGGGLKSNGVHNVLEAAVYNKPVLFGPHYHQYSGKTPLNQLIKLLNRRRFIIPA
jgi:3-deoxy-D-manno-octulosonic-acid transferase